MALKFKALDEADVARLPIAWEHPVLGRVIWLCPHTCACRFPTGKTTPPWLPWEVLNFEGPSAARWVEMGWREVPLEEAATW